MECTQRLECTQELNNTQTERTCPEQIGYLGICGAKHPVLKGPNKIGRDPQTCNIILNLNSISRQHAVINVLNSKEFMVMDLDSANKTKLLNKTLQPYIPHRIKDGDTVQFGDIFGVFRLLEEDNELPMTQAIDIPETPVTFKHVSKLNKAPTTLIPESPDVSDKDDSFLTPSQPISVKSRLSNSFIKTNATLPTQGKSPNTSIPRRLLSPKKSTSSFVHNPNTSLNESVVSLKTGNVSDNIYEADTQVPNLVANESTDSIFTAGTQIPPEIAMSPSVHTMDTQVPTVDHVHTMHTQMPTVEHLPQVRKINDQHEMQIDIYADNKENNKDIFNAETQPFGIVDDSIENVNKNKSNVSNISRSSAEGDKKDILNTSEEEVLFDDIDGECFEEDFHSQNILQGEIPLIDEKDESKPKDSPIPCNRDKGQTSDDLTDCEDIDMLPTQKIPELAKQETKKEPKIQDKNDPTCSKRTVRIKSDSSTDCEDIDVAPTQIVTELPAVKDSKLNADKITNKPSKRVNRIKSDSSTDCEDIDIAPTQIIPALPVVKDSKIKTDNITNKPSKRVNRIKSDSSTDCEDIDLMATQKIPEIKPAEDDDATDCEDDVIVVNQKEPPPIPLIDDDTQIATQIIEVDNNKKEKIPLEDMATQIINVDEGVSGSKNVAFEDQPTQIIEEAVPANKESLKKPINVIESPFKIPFQSPIRIKSKDIPKVNVKDKIEKSNPIEVDPNYYNDTQDIFDDLCTQRDKPEVQLTTDDEVVPCSVEDYKVKDKFAGIEKDLSPFKNEKDNIAEIAKLEKVPSGDLSDVDSTPKKAKPFVFIDSDLPSSQEIKKCLVSHTRSFGTEESSSESETENSIHEPYNPFKKINKKKRKPSVVVDLTKRLEVDKLPERVITRQRKPALNTESISPNILKPTYLTEQEDHIDQEIITENIKRLKTYERAKSNKNSKKDESVKEEKKENVSRKKTDKVTEPKDKIKGKIEKPKKNETKSKSETPRTSDKSHNNQVQEEESLDTATVSKPTTRSTRSKKKDTECETNENKSSTYKATVKDNKKKRTNKKQEKERSKSPEMVARSTERARTPKSRSKSPEMEVRRSKRQRKPKTKFEESEVKAPKSILKNSTHEQSTVYNISSSSSESPRSLKRSMLDCSDAPSSKRTRAQTNSSSTSGIGNASLRATPARVMKTHHVLFTAFPSADVKQKLEKLGAVIVTNVMECTVVLTMQIKRTFKLLCAVGLGRPIVGPGWVQACADTHMIVDPWLYLVKDEAAEQRFQFNLQRTLSSNRNFLKGYNVSSTPNVQPNASEMKLIVECSGGTWKESGPNWVCVSCPKDKDLWPALRRRGAIMVSTEFILGGVLRQKLEIASNTLN